METCFFDHGDLIGAEFYVANLKHCVFICAMIETWDSAYMVTKPLIPLPDRQPCLLYPFYI